MAFRRGGLSRASRGWGLHRPEVIDPNKVTPKLTDHQALELALELLDVVRNQCEAGHPSWPDFVLIARTILHGHPQPPSRG